jgi:hypothetical protein
MDKEPAVRIRISERSLQAWIGAERHGGNQDKPGDESHDDSSAVTRHYKLMKRPATEVRAH